MSPPVTMPYARSGLYWIVTMEDKEGISSNLLLACPLEKAKLKDLAMTSKNPPCMVKINKDESKKKNVK